MTTTTLTVHGGWEAFGVADFSPFGLKVQAYLRMIGVPYTAKLGDPRTGPKKKIPFIDDEGTRVGDSGLILDYLKKKHGDTLDAKLTPEQHALGHLVRRTLEESLYWVLIYSRWLEDGAWPHVREMLLPVMPPVIGSLIANGPIRGSVRKSAFAQGIGRHARDHIYAIGCADVDAIAAVLGDKPFLLGDAPSSYDATLYGFIANTLAFPAESPMTVRARSHANLVAFVQRVNDTYWAAAPKA
jgi:glutathione S-transferase